MAGTVYGGLENPKLTYSERVKLNAGVNKISLLSVAVGLPVRNLKFQVRFTFFFLCLYKFIHNI